MQGAAPKTARCARLPNRPRFSAAEPTPPPGAHAATTRSQLPAAQALPGSQPNATCVANRSDASGSVGANSKPAYEQINSHPGCARPRAHRLQSLHPLLLFRHDDGIHNRRLQRHDHCVDDRLRLHERRGVLEQREQQQQHELLGERQRRHFDSEQLGELLQLLVAAVERVQLLVLGEHQPQLQLQQCVLEREWLDGRKRLVQLRHVRQQLAVFDR